MAAQKGFQYEVNAYKALLDYGISAGGPPAGAAHDRPDLEIKLSSMTTDKYRQGCELKISPTAAGSLVLKYYAGQWMFGDIGDDPEKILLVSLAQKYKVLQNMNKSGAAGARWRGKVPYLQNDEKGKKILVGAKDKRKAYEKDLKQFGGTNEVKIDIPAKAICDYYNSKATDYLNVGTHGFYLMNKRDPLGLNKKIKGAKIPDFANEAKAKIRVRCQYKGGGDYQFVMTLEFSSVTKSPYNLAPTASASSVAINKSKLDSTENAPLLEAFRM
jgi:hypothetical protein